MKPEDFAGELSFYRGKSQMTQVKLAEALEVTDRTIKLWENGDSVPRKGMRIKIAQIFKLPVSYFLWEEEKTDRIAQQEASTAEQQLFQLQNQFADYLADPDISSDLKKSLVGSVWDTIQKTYTK